MNNRTPSRVRDPDRRERILDAAADLIAVKGYLGVNMGDIGAAAGIVGSGVYRHFDSKGAILVELFNRVVDRLVDDAERSFSHATDARETLEILVASQVNLVLEQRSVCQVYVREARNLPEQDQLRLRWKQRHYVALWESALHTIHPTQDNDEVKVVVRAAIGSIHSILNTNLALESEKVSKILRDIAFRSLNVAMTPSTEPADS